MPPRTVLHTGRLLCRLGLVVAWLAVSVSVAGAEGAAPAAPGLRIEACGGLAARPAGADAAGPGRIARPGELLTPDDPGLGCRFTIPGEPRGEAVLVEARLTRPSLAGDGQAEDRWYVPARRGEATLAEHRFGRPGEAEAGDWTLALYLDGRPAGEWRFTVRQTSEEPVPPAALPAAPQVAAGGRPSPPPPPLLPDRPAKAGHRDTARSNPAAATPSGRPSGAKAAAPSPKTALPARAPAVAPSPALPASGQAAASGHFALQTGVFGDAGKASSQAARLRERGLPACVAVDGSGPGARYRVLAGRFGDRRGALGLRDQVASVVGGGVMVRQVDPETAAHLRCH